MSIFRDFLCGVIAGVLNTFIGSFVVGFLPSFPYSFYITQPLLLGVWVIVASLILKKLGH